MDKPTYQTDAQHWRTALADQRRTIAWLAVETGKSPRTLYAYSRGVLRPTDDWLRAASQVLGVEVTR